MKAFAFILLSAAALSACGAPNLSCTTTACSTGTSTYQICTSLTGGETWKFGSASCQAAAGNTTQVETCTQQVMSFCTGGGTGTGGSTSGSTSGTSGGACSYTVSGAQSSGGGCTVDAAVTPTSNGVGLTVTAGAAFTFGATFSSQTTLTTGTFSQADAAPGFGAEYLVGVSGSYDMCSDSSNCHDPQGDVTPAQGSFSLDVSATGPSTSVNGSTLWTSPSGTLTVIMPAQPNGAESGTVTVTVML